MKYWIRAAIVMCALGASVAGAEDLFPGGNARKIERLADVPSGTTMGGYPLYTGGRDWKLQQHKVVNNNRDVPIGYLQLTSLLDGNYFADMFVVATLSGAIEEGYFSADLCSPAKSHLFKLNKASGRNDNCLLIDPLTARIEGTDLTLLHIKVRNSQSSLRLYDLSLYVDLGKMGFPGAMASDWTPSAVAADPKKQKFLDKVVAWAKQLQDGVNKAIAFSKPQDAFDGVPAIQTLLAAD